MKTAIRARNFRLRMVWLGLPVLALASGCGNSISPTNPTTATAVTIVASASPLSCTTSGFITLNAVVTNSSGSAFAAPSSVVNFYANGIELPGNAVATPAGNGYATSYTLTNEPCSALPVQPGNNSITAQSQADAVHMAGASTNTVIVTVTSGTTGSGVATTTTLVPTVNAQGTLLTATVTAASGTVAPTGPVEFYDETTQQSLGIAYLQSSTTTSATVNLQITSSSAVAAGSNAVIAEYQGSGSAFTASNSAPVAVTSNPQGGTTATTTALVESVTSVTAAGTVTFTATVTGSGSVAPTGQVVFLNQTTGISLPETLMAGSTAGTGTSSITVTGDVLADGANSIIVSYAGDGNYAASISPAVIITLTGGGGSGTATTTVVSVSPNSVAPGGCVNITAQITGSATSNSQAPTGTVTLTVNGLTLGTVGVSYMSEGVSDGYTGICSNPGTVLGGSGTYQIVATYSGDSTYATSSNGTGTQVTVTGTQKANVNFSAGVPQGSSSTISLGSCGTVDGNVTPIAEPNGVAPTGSVLFQLNYTTSLGTVAINSAGTAALNLCTGPNTAITTTGSYTINGAYTGDDNYNAGTSNPNAVVVVD